MVAEDHAIPIARDLSTKDPQIGSAGYFTRFAVNRTHLDEFPVQRIRGSEHLKLCVSAGELPQFKRNFLGLIEVTRECRDEPGAN